MTSDSCLLKLTFRWSGVPENISSSLLNEICKITLFGDFYTFRLERYEWMTLSIDSGWTKSGIFLERQWDWRIRLNQSGWENFPDDTYKIVFYAALNRTYLDYITYPEVDVPNYEAELKSTLLPSQTGEEIPSDEFGELKKFDHVIKFEIEIRHSSSFITQFQPIVDISLIIRSLTSITFIISCAMFLLFCLGKSRFPAGILSEVAVGILVFWPIYLLGIRVYCPPWPTSMDILARGDVLECSIIIFVSILSKLIQFLYQRKTRKDQVS